MYLKKKLRCAIVAAPACLLLNYTAQAQLTGSAQIRTRAELRNGQGAPLPEKAPPAFFISQRTRLNLLYTTYRIKLGVSVQDVRVWGQDVSTTNKSTTQDNNGLLLHEAWAEILLSDTANRNSALSLKLGRQELVYDDQRLIGNLDWLQQGRRHDAMLLKYEKASWRLHLAAAFNQNKENASGTIYTSTPPGNYTAGTNGATMYKSLAFLYAGKKLKQGTASLLFFTDQFNKYHTETIGGTTTKVYETGAWSRFTTGAYLNNNFHQLALTAGAYYQFGTNAAGQQVNAEMINLLALYPVGKKLTVGAGLDYTSGGTSASGTHQFDPLYGTPHKFWGLMDYFYAASAFGSGGLMDYYLRGKWKINARQTLTADGHQFSSAVHLENPAKPGDNAKSFGQEIDLVYNYAVTPQIVLEGGYSHFFSTDLLTSSVAKNVAAARSGSDWAYIMISIKPEFLFK
jgi:hypothetical protein